MTDPKTYKVGDIFKPIPDDPENVILQIPPEICEQMGWVEGTKLKITAQDGIITITKA